MICSDKCKNHAHGGLKYSTVPYRYSQYSQLRDLFLLMKTKTKKHRTLTIDQKTVIKILIIVSSRPMYYIFPNYCSLVGQRTIISLREINIHGLLSQERKQL